MSNNIKDDHGTPFENDDHSRFAAPDFKENEFGAKGTHNHSTGGEVVPRTNSHDFNLGEEACALLQKNPDVDASEIIVTVHEHTVILRGTVEHKREKREAEHCLKSIPEITNVVNELQIRR